MLENKKYLPIYMEKDLNTLVVTSISVPFNGVKFPNIFYRILFILLRIFSCCCMLVYIKLAFIIICQAYPDVNALFNTFGLNTTLSVGMLKVGLFNFRKTNIDQLLNTLSDEIFKQNKSKHEEILMNNVKNMNFFRALYYITVCFSVSFFVLRYLQSGFNFEIFITTYVVAYLACGITVIDLVVVGLLSEATAQITILLYEIENVVELAYEEMNKEEGSNVGVAALEVDSKKEYYLNEQLKNCIRHHLHILKFVKDISVTFSELFAAQFTGIVAVLGITVYNVATEDFGIIDFIWSFFYLSCMLQQIYIFCHLATALTAESMKLPEAIYKSSWNETSVSFRKNLMIMSENCRKPMAPTAAAILPMSLYTFVKILKTSYSAYAFLSKSKKY